MPVLLVKVKPYSARSLDFNMRVTTTRSVVNHFWRVENRYFMYTAVLHLVYSNFIDGDLWLIVGCYNGSRYKQS